MIKFKNTSFHLILFYIPVKHMPKSELEHSATLFGSEYEVNSQKIDTRPYITFCKTSCMQGQRLS
jgi:hypothetical protein